ncbi:hypothetical protein FZW96_03865 [Bacillus sp. BGMRC 2118]|nr:hypothetical protein FZW96_03865 [Bacillus sp. BGMRC 2118]
MFGIKPIQSKDKLDHVGEFYHRVSQANIDYYHFWKEETFLHWEFWLSCACTILPWLLWWKVHKRSSRARLITVRLFVVVITSWFDAIGTIYGFWYYSGKNFSSIPSYIPWDFCIFPVIIMLLIQFKNHISAWEKALFFASIGTFIGEPLFWWLGMYVIEKWNMLYSFPIYSVIYLLADRLSKAQTFEVLYKVEEFILCLHFF